jgi:hypothetical protein
VNLVLRRLANEALGISECDPGRRGSLAKVVGHDLNLALLEHSNAAVSVCKVSQYLTVGSVHHAVRCAQVDSDDGIVLIAGKLSFVFGDNFFVFLAAACVALLGSGSVGDDSSCKNCSDEQNSGGCLDAHCQCSAAVNCDG